VATHFDQAMQLMRRHNPQQQEAGFDLLRSHAAEHISELLTEFGREHDHGLRCWLLELIGEAGSEQALPLLTEQLHATDPALRDWAIHGLRKLDTPEARYTLYKARTSHT
jgi:HEAT repeat protein